MNRQNEFLRQVLDMTPDLVFVKDRQGRYLLANKAMADAYGATPQGMTGKTDLELGARPEEAAKYQQDNLEVLTSGKEKFIPEEPCTRSPGEVRYFQTTKRPLVDEAGNCTGVLAVSVDITRHRQATEALRESEQRYRALVENAYEAIFVIQDGVFKFVNAAMTRMTGRSAERLIGSSPFGYVHPEDQARVIDIHRRRMAGEEVPPRVELRAIDTQGESHWLELYSARIEWQGRPAQLALCNDITGSKRLEEEARQAHLAMRERLKELNCLYRVAQTEEECDDNLDEFFGKVAQILPEAFLHDSAASARIVFRGSEFKSGDYRQPLSSLAAPITVGGKEAGVVEASYSSPQPPLDEGPFTKEERSFLNAAGRRLGRAAERVLAHRQVALERVVVEQKNNALREIMSRIQEEKERLGRQVLTNVDRVVMPILDSLAGTLSPRQRRHVAMLKDALNEITSPFAERLSRLSAALTPTELRMCALIKQGYTGKEIAEIEHVSPDTVRTHRFQIRRKLGLLNKAVNLAGYLQSIAAAPPA